MMSADVTPIFQPDAAAMLQHVEHLFGGFLDGFHEGLIELAWTRSTANTDGRYPLNQAAYFKTDQLDELVEKAVALNSQPMCNVYIGAALRHPDTFPGGRSKDEDAWALTARYVDFDDPGVAASAKDRYHETKPTFIVVTGREPYLRAQAWWRLTTPETDPDHWSAGLLGMAQAMGGDGKVHNAGRVMRLAGSIAWPVKPGRVTELTTVAPLKVAGPAAYTAEQLSAKWAPVTAEQAAADSVDISGVVREADAFGHGGNVTDGRDAYMARTVLAVMVEFIGENGAVPTAQELFDLAWPQFAAHADMTRPGHNTPELMRDKVAYALRRFARGQIRGARTLDEAVASYQAKEKRRPFDHATDKPPPADGGPFPATAFTGEPPERQWIVPEWIPAGVVTSLYGDGGVGKTLLAQQLIYAAGIGGKFLGMQVPAMRALGVFCEDDRDELHRRHNAIKTHLGHALDNPFERTLLWPRVGHDNLLVTFDRNNVPVFSAFFKTLEEKIIAERVDLLILDNAADLFGGNEIIRAQVNFFIKAVVGRIIQKCADAGWMLSVVLLAHPSQAGKNSGSGESGSTGWNAAVRSRLYLTKPEDGEANARVLTRMKANYAASGQDTAINVVWENGVLRVASAGFAWPDKHTCDNILKAIDGHWRDGRPLSIAAQTKALGRYAPKVLPKHHAVSPAMVERMIEQWLETGVLTVEQANSDTKQRGLKVLIWP